MQRALMMGMALSAMSGACRPPRVGASSPVVSSAEPLALVDFPGDERPTGVQFLGDGGFVASFRLGRQSGVRFRTLQGGAWSRPDVGPEENEGGEGVAVSPDGAVAAVAQYAQVQLVPLAGGDVRTVSLRGPASNERCAAPWRLVWGGPRSTLAVQCALGAPLALIHVDDGSRVYPMLDHDTEGHSHRVRSISVSRDGRTLVVLGETEPDAGGDVTTWVETRAIVDGALQRRMTLTRAFASAALSPDNARLAVSSPYWGLQILEVATGRVLAESTYTPDRDDRGSGDVVWSPDGALLYRVGRRLSVAIHDGATAALRGHLPAHRGDVAVAPAPGEAATLGGHNGHLALSADGRYLASVSRADIGEGRARAVRVWRLPAPHPRPAP